ncbi:ABC transporter ATP-binding protein [Aestuariispira insulae]|uniref:Amino acid/amide ABC transporter ATP-binding protein 1 (HAAT family) n=1 Tax=Aestuariispira insulae TaxID=1461337 RepID=A0A3D9HNS1_9PROT|nr:ABC transporter ATP-binding protein [Aestuariispira insulae]RED51055.1 amino acid/amide ABC transporter ATP-binding protein 1 (HAAT family) [Aestuariispira insulae]
MISIQSLSKSFGGVKAVNGCSFDIEQGTITGLIGPNGAGKTTLFNMIAGAFAPTSGKIIYQGQDVTGLRADQLFHKGIVRTFQIPHEFERMTALENLMMVPPGQNGENLFRTWFSWAGVRNQEREVRKKGEEVLEFLQLTHIRDELAGNLSGGQKKLLELGRTMMTEAKVVLLDEPGAGVNRTLLAKLAEMIKQLRDERGYTFALIEHDMDLIAHLCDPVVCMAQGAVLCQGDFESVRSNEEVLEAYLGSSAHQETEGKA